MKTNSRTRNRQAGASMIDVLVIVIVVVGVFVMLLLAFGRDAARARAKRISCFNQLKSLSTGLRLWAGDNDGRYPFQYLATGATNSQGTPVPRGWSVHPTNLWMLFQVAANDLSIPRILVCPSDSARFPAQDFNTNSASGYSSDSFSHPSKRNLAVSYFFGINADEAFPTRMLGGDRNLDRDPKRTDHDPGGNYLKGEQRLGSSDAEVKDLRWNADMHDRGGNIAFMDGSVQQLTSGALRSALKNSGDKTNRIWLPQ